MISWYFYLKGDRDLTYNSSVQPFVILFLFVINTTEGFDIVFKYKLRSRWTPGKTWRGLAQLWNTSVVMRSLQQRPWMTATPTGSPWRRLLGKCKWNDQKYLRMLSNKRMNNILNTFYFYSGSPTYIVKIKYVLIYNNNNSLRNRPSFGQKLV